MSIELPRRPAWHASAACRGTDPGLFYPDDGVRADDLAAAKALCAACPVQIECYLDGINEQHGIWAGTTLQDRRDARRVSA